MHKIVNCIIIYHLVFKLHIRLNGDQLLVFKVEQVI